MLFIVSLEFLYCANSPNIMCIDISIYFFKISPVLEEFNEFDFFSSTREIPQYWRNFSQKKYYFVENVVKKLHYPYKNNYNLFIYIRHRFTSNFLPLAHLLILLLRK